MSEKDQITDMLTAEETAERGLLRPRLLKVAGVGMAGMLALSACAGTDDDADTDDDAQDQTEENGEEAAEEEAEDEVPAFEDIADDMFDAMEAQDNVTIVGEGPIFSDEADEVADEEDDDAEDAAASVTMRGDIDGENAEAELPIGGETMNLMSVDGDVFVSSLLVSFDLHAEAEAFGEDDLVDWDALNADLEGTWMDGTTQYSSSGFTAADLEDLSVGAFIEGMREGFEESSEEAEDEAEGLLGGSGDSFEGELDERDGEEVWVYTDDETEIVVLADEEEPLPLSIESEDDGEVSTVTFEDWNETEVEAPEDGDILDDADFEDLLFEHADEEAISEL